MSTVLISTRTVLCRLRLLLVRFTVRLPRKSKPSRLSRWALRVPPPPQVAVDRLPLRRNPPSPRAGSGIYTDLQSDPWSLLLRELHSDPGRVPKL